MTKEKSPAELAAASHYHQESILSGTFHEHSPHSFLAGVRWLAAELEKRGETIMKIGNDGYPVESQYVELKVVKELVGEE